MASDPSSQMILITGGSGFIGAHVLNAFLSRGYKVRATVRSTDTALKVAETHSEYSTQLTFTIVADMATPGAFDEAVKGVSGVIHVASPVRFYQAKNNEEDILDPAIKGTVGILESTHKNNPDVKRIVITGSIAAVIPMTEQLPPDYTFTEADTSPLTLESGVNSPAGVGYAVSKVFAEKAAFEFVEEQRPNFNVTTIIPAITYGPVINAVDSVENLCVSAMQVWNWINGHGQLGRAHTPTFSDVRDVAEAHLRAFEGNLEGSQRIFAVNGLCTNQMAVNIIRQRFPQLKNRLPAGEPDEPVDKLWKFSNEKAKKELGLTFRSLEESIVDMVNSLLKLEAEWKAMGTEPDRHAYMSRF